MVILMHFQYAWPLLDSVSLMQPVIGLQWLVDDFITTNIFILNIMQ